MAEKHSTSQNPEFTKSPRRRKTSPRLLIRVTRDIIDTAVPKDSGHCMLSDAVKAAFPGAIAISSDLQTIRFSDPAKGLRYVYLTPRIAQAALIEFDNEIKPHPFQCELARAAQIISMKRRETGGRQVNIHDLGRKHLQPEGEYGVPTLIGGKSLPVMREPRKQESVDLSPPETALTAVPETALTAVPETALTAVPETANRGGRPRARREFGLRAFKSGKDILISG